MMQNNSLLIAWLRDAHSMEKALQDFLAKANKDFAHAEAAQEQLDILAGKSGRAQIELQEQLGKLGEKPSGGKDLLGKILGVGSGIGSSMYKDDAVKDLLALNGIFHFAHASYVSLTHAARQSENNDLADICDRLARERKEAAEWVIEQVPGVTKLAMETQSDA